MGENLSFCTELDSLGFELVSLVRQVNWDQVNANFEAAKAGDVAAVV
jgi:hypothetical protein